MTRLRRGQSLSEYAVLIGVVAAAVVSMQLYVKRGVQAKLKVGVDHWLASSTMSDGHVPQDCADAGHNDPADCAQFFGAQIDDDRPGVNTVSATVSNGDGKKQVSYNSTGAQVSITDTRDGTSVTNVSLGRTVTIGLPFPQFIRQPKLPTGLGGSGSTQIPRAGVGLPDPGGPTEPPTPTPTGPPGGGQPVPIGPTTPTAPTGPQAGQ